MKLSKVLLAPILVALGFLLLGCLPDASPTTGSSSTDMLHQNNDAITPRGVNVTPDGNQISFHGLSSLPDGTLLQTQLYEGPHRASWWPTDQYAQVEGGEWRITVLPGKAAGHFYPGSDTTFRLEVWQRDDPSIRSRFIFSMAGPPRVRK